MIQDTKRTESATLGDLLDRGSHAMLAFAKDGRAEIIPVRFLSSGERYWVGVTADGAAELSSGTAVTLVVDDGCPWLDLRAVQVRGVVVPTSAPPVCGGVLQWLEVLPSSVSAWNCKLVGERSAASAH